MHLVTNTQISHGPKKADRPEIRFEIKQQRNHSTTQPVCDADHPSQMPVLAGQMRQKGWALPVPPWT